MLSATYINDLLRNEIKIIGIHEGIFEKAQVAYPYGTAKLNC